MTTEPNPAKLSLGPLREARRRAHAAAKHNFETGDKLTSPFVPTSAQDVAWRTEYRRVRRLLTTEAGRAMLEGEG